MTPAQVLYMAAALTPSEVDALYVFSTTERVVSNDIVYGTLRNRGLVADRRSTNTYSLTRLGKSVVAVRRAADDATEPEWVQVLREKYSATAAPHGGWRTERFAVHPLEDGRLSVALRKSGRAYSPVVEATCSPDDVIECVGFVMAAASQFTACPF